MRGLGPVTDSRVYKKIGLSVVLSVAIFGAHSYFDAQNNASLQ